MRGMNRLVGVEGGREMIELSRLFSEDSAPFHTSFGRRTAETRNYPSQMSWKRYRLLLPWDNLGN